MKDIIIDDFQNSVDECLLRHRSILDILTKLQESESRINRAVAKSVTSCGCIEINAASKSISIDKYENQKECYNKGSDTHLYGKLCPNCREIIEQEIGNNLFYLASLCNLLDLNLYDIFLKEEDRINTLGKFTLR
ncbi:hypothetical protein CLTEP_07890 [Clostridium tepidiprofundi DSM 19306]|uniref:DUF1573 domain-containing protein n=1 Tax=Clostridium tepidiprofundi DSM 19306 TaxID=1121338 RepID=A0A151B5I2_9CLOT|nr:DUF1573 domain-containing protein [Clostridium tepidiprofundi]KYH35165.1 hypothetical protein CLTEP_07890 [Clostridium tepidiprofundi DSM 19306]